MSFGVSHAHMRRLGWPARHMHMEKRVRAFWKKGYQMSNNTNNVFTIPPNNNHKILVNCLVTPKKKQQHWRTENRTQNTKPCTVCAGAAHVRHFSSSLPSIHKTHIFLLLLLLLPRCFCTNRCCTVTILLLLLWSLLFKYVFYCSSGSKQAAAAEPTLLPRDRLSNKRTCKIININVDRRVCVSARCVSLCLLTVLRDAGALTIYCGVRI